MILVDSSVWIASLRRDAKALESIRLAHASDDVGIPDIVLLEVLQDARDDDHAIFLEARFRTFPIVPAMSEHIAMTAARNDRLLRAKGFTIRKTADLIIGTLCVEYGYRLLHADRDFDSMEKHLGLMVIR